MNVLKSHDQNRLFHFRLNKLDFYYFLNKFALLFSTSKMFSCVLITLFTLALGQLTHDAAMDVISVISCFQDCVPIIA